ncbi:MAG: hypothetical protein IH616_08835 [Gemmatimonadales bacterium]|jgi:hypothetical protein|nr:hypothetical protein [Gemmatimonadales bacterium]
MRRHSALRVVLTLVASIALVAPYAAQFGCAGKPCCTSGMAAHQHESPGNAIADHVGVQHCPTMAACGVTTSPTVLPTAAAVPLLAETFADDARPSSPYRSPAPAHHTPPPRV